MSNLESNKHFGNYKIKLVDLLDFFFIKLVSHKLVVLYFKKRESNYTNLKREWRNFFFLDISKFGDSYSQEKKKGVGTKKTKLNAFSFCVALQN